MPTWPKSYRYIEVDAEGSFVFRSRRIKAEHGGVTIFTDTVVQWLQTPQGTRKLLTGGVVIVPEARFNAFLESAPEWFRPEYA